MSENVEIILNDVNVSGCKYLNNSKDGLLCTLYDYNVFYDMRCSDNSDCYYKQLQRKKLKNKKLTEDFNKLKQKNEDIENKYLPITARLAKRFKTFREAKGINYDGILSEFLAENEKLKNTLKEIAEIAKAKVYAPICFDDPDCPKNGGVGFDNGCDEYCPILTIEKILEKIKEVKNENKMLY